MDKLSTDLNLCIASKKEREIHRESWGDPRRKDREKGGRQGFEGESARAHLNHSGRRRRRRPFSKAGPKTSTMARTPPLFLLPSLYRPGLSSSARCFPSPAGQKDELLAKEVGLQCSTWSECTMLEFVKLYFGNFAALSLVKTSHSGHYNLNQPTCCASLCLLLVCIWKALTIFAVSSLYS